MYCIHLRSIFHSDFSSEKKEQIDKPISSIDWLMIDVKLKLIKLIINSNKSHRRIHQFQFWFYFRIIYGLNCVNKIKYKNNEIVWSNSIGTSSLHILIHIDKCFTPSAINRFGCCPLYVGVVNVSTSVV